MNKEDVPSRTASFTFTIDNILNLKQNNSNSKQPTDIVSGCKNEYQNQCRLCDVGRRHESSDAAQEPGECVKLYNNSIILDKTSIYGLTIPGTLWVPLWGSKLTRTSL